MPRYAGWPPTLSLALFLSFASPAAATPSPDRGPFVYISPVPGARYVLTASNLIVRPEGLVDPASIDRDLFEVKGSRSGDHAGRTLLSDDGRTILFLPSAPFEAGETVVWRVKAGIRTDRRGALPSLSGSFTTAGVERSGPYARAAAAAASEEVDPSAFGPRTGLPPRIASEPATAPSAVAASDTLPEDVPRLTRTVAGGGSPGRIFLCSVVLLNPDYRSYLIIAGDDGRPVFTRRLPGRGFDFKRQPDGRLTYYDAASLCFYAMDAHYTVVDSFRCGNGYTTDLHDLQLLPDGHALLISYDPEPVDMSAVVPGGNPAATVLGAVIQELDRGKNVVFQWRSWDHFRITDATHMDFTAPTIDYAHVNAVALDRDGNLLLSSRHMEEVTKVNRETGEIIWRMGGKNNQFSFPNDPTGFSYQHDIRRLENGDVTLFDNGVFHTPRRSRAVEYRLDETAHVATLVWKYVPDPPIVAVATGSVQRLPTGNTLIGWGSASSPTVTEVSPTGERVTELAFPTDVTSYRAFRLEWPPVRDADVRFSPHTVSARSAADWVYASVASEGFDPKDVNRYSVRLNRWVPCDPSYAALEPAGVPGPRSLRIRFDRASVVSLLHRGSNRVAVTGSLATGELFRGEADLKVGGTPAGTPRSRAIALASAVGALPVVVSIPDPSGSRASVEVFDVRGRRVIQWSAMPDESGRIGWDGRDERGDLVASGVYFVRAATPQGDATLKVVVAR